MNNYLKRVEPLLISDDKIVRQTWLAHISDYPQVPVELLNKLMAFADQEKEARKKVLMYADEFPKDETTIQYIVKWLPTATEEERISMSRFVRNAPAPVLNKYKNELKPVVHAEYIRFKMDLFSSDVNDTDALWELLDDFLHELMEKFNSSIFKNAIMVLDRLIELGVYDEQEVIESLDIYEGDDAVFSNYSILAVYACGVMKLHEQIPRLAKLLTRENEDVLKEEVVRALISFQSDDVVEAVAPLIFNEDASFEVIDVLKNTKTPLAEQVLIKAYGQANEVHHQELLIEALTTHFSERAFLFIEQFFEADEFEWIVDMDEVCYAFYKAMGKHHPLLEEWAEEIKERDEFFDAEAADLFSVKASTPVTVEKIGRNDPCNCGSGKKYKKCCEN